jgi:hypothetical protein
MLKKGLIISAAVLLLVGAFIGYRQIRERSLFERTDLYSVVSSRAVLVIETKNLMHFSKALLYENDYWKLTKKTGFLSNFNDYIEKIDFLYTKNPDFQQISDRQALIIYNASNDSVNNPKELLAIKCTKKEAQKCIQLIQENLYKNTKIEEIRHQSTKVSIFTEGAQLKYACAYVEGILLASSNLSEVQKAIELSSAKGSLRENQSFIAVKSTSGKNSLANIFINVRRLAPFLSKKIDIDFPMLRNAIANYSDWMGLDISISNNQLLLNGYSNTNKEFSTSIFEQQQPLSIGLCQQLPFNTCFFTHYGISNYPLFKQKIDEKKATIVPKRNILLNNEQFILDHFAGEVAIGYVNSESTLKGNSYVMFSLKDSTFAVENLDKFARKTDENSSYSAQKTTVYELPHSFNLTGAFGDFIQLGGIEYATVVGKYMLVANSETLLVDLAGQVSSGYTLSKNPVFGFVAQSYDAKSSSLCYIHFPSLIKYASEIFDKSIADNLINNQAILNQIQAVGCQMDCERGMTYQSAFFKYGTIKKDSLPEKKSNRIVWQIDFNSQPVFGPVTVENKETGADEILIQDSKNKLYLYTHDGHQVWAVQLDSPIMGDAISQIDFSKNKKSQFVFNTAKKIYIIDRKGFVLKNYPIVLPAQATAPMAVFDYDDNLDYRFIIPCANKKIYVYNKDRKLIPDFVFNNAKGLITNQIQHVRIDAKDYLLVNDGTKAYILDRRGAERVKIKSDFVVSKNSHFYLQETQEGNSLLITDKQGYIKRIGFDGSVKSIKACDSLSSNHTFIVSQVANAPIYIFLDNNKISIHNQQMKCMFVKHTEEQNLIPILSNDLLAVYSPSSSKTLVFDLKQLDTPEQFFVSESKPYLGKLKPMPNNYLISFTNGKLVCYEFH